MGKEWNTFVHAFIEKYTTKQNLKEFYNILYHSKLTVTSFFVLKNDPLYILSIYSYTYFSYWSPHIERWTLMWQSCCYRKLINTFWANSSQLKRFNILTQSHCNVFSVRWSCSSEWQNCSGFSRDLLLSEWLSCHPRQTGPRPVGCAVYLNAVWVHRVM